MIFGSGSYLHDPAGIKRLGKRSVLILLLSLSASACERAPSAIPISPVPPDPVATATDRPEPPADPTQTPLPDHEAGLAAPLFEDDFSRDTGWSTGSSSRGAISRLNDQLVVAVRGPGAALASLSPVPALADLLVSVEVRTEICDSGDEFGLMVRTRSPNGSVEPARDSHYRFMLTCEGAVRASRFIAGSEAALIPITQTFDAIPGAPALNRLAVSAEGNQLRFFINDMEVFEIRDGELLDGSIGLIVRARSSLQTTVAFDNFRVWDLSSDT